MSTPSPAPVRERLLWPDIAKGLCILLVVLHHLVGKHYLPSLDDVHGPVADAWTWLTRALKPVRMPVFFVISGYFAAASLARPWRALARRILTNYYLYVVWLVLYLGLYTVETTMPANRTLGLRELGLDLLWSSTSMWFLYALAVYVVLAKLLRPVWPVALAAAAALAFATPSFGIEEANRFSVLACFVWFALGAYLPALVRGIVDRRPPVLPLVAGWALLAQLQWWHVLPDGVGLLLTGAEGVLLGLAIAARLQGARLAPALSWLGQRTLRIYVLHLVVLAAVVHLPSLLPTSSGVLATIFVALYPLLATALVAAACFGLHAVLLRLRAGWLFTLPWPAGGSTSRPGSVPAGNPART